MAHEMSHHWMDRSQVREQEHDRGRRKKRRTILEAVQSQRHTIGVQQPYIRWRFHLCNHHVGKISPEGLRHETECPTNSRCYLGDYRIALQSHAE